jgi:hypothetical protein
VQSRPRIYSRNEDRWRSSRLGCTTVSVAIRKLEEEIGAALFDRSRGFPCLQGFCGDRFFSCRTVHSVAVRGSGNPRTPRFPCSEGLERLDHFVSSSFLKPPPPCHLRNRCSRSFVVAFSFLFYCLLPDSLEIAFGASLERMLRAFALRRISVLGHRSGRTCGSKECSSVIH